MKVLLPISAAIFMAASMGAASAVTSEVRQPWCSTDKDSALNCVYPTLTACEQVTRGEGGACIPDPRPPVKK